MGDCKGRVRDPYTVYGFGHVQHLVRQRPDGSSHRLADDRDVIQPHSFASKDSGNGGFLQPTPAEPVERETSLLMKIHFVLGTVSLASFSTALVLGAASGNLGKLNDPARCCPDGGDRHPGIRTANRVLVNVGIGTYLAAGGTALYNLLFEDPPSDPERKSHRAHRWLALAHLAVFAVSATTGIIMSGSQSSDYDRFATTSRIHVAANVLLVPLLSVSLADILLE